jgi:predicted N-acetyltransferase YhbS
MDTPGPSEAAASHVTIRALAPADLDAVVALDAQVFGESRRAYFERRLAFLQPGSHGSHTIGLVAQVGGSVVGLIMGTLTSGEFGFPQVTALVDSVAVHPDHQREGIGRQLAIAFMAECVRQDAREVYTLVNWNAWDILRFFDSLGFSLASTVPLRRHIDEADVPPATRGESDER